MEVNNNQKEMKTHEDVFILKRKIARTDNKILQVSRSLEANGRVIYSDNITREMFHHTLNNPDLFRLVELFSMGKIGLHIREHAASRAQNRKRMAELFKRIWVKFRPHKLKFHIKFFKLCTKN